MSWVASDWITPCLSYEISPIGLAVSHFLALDLLWWYTVDVESEENSFQELVVPEKSFPAAGLLVVSRDAHP
ncbi:MAG: hypothetical protein EBE86_004955 [Hormoscilla sp. GUM202]|nr:hypothetical protein [Hormoscilla sp. GUM202]